jgi:hypothetical protein
MSHSHAVTLSTRGFSVVSPTRALVVEEIGGANSPYHTCFTERSHGTLPDAREYDTAVHREAAKSTWRLRLRPQVCANLI